MEVPWPRTESAWDPSHDCPNSGSFNPLCQARDQPHNSTVTWATVTGFLNPPFHSGNVCKTFSFSFFFFLGPHPRHMEVLRPGVEMELQPPAYAAATATGFKLHLRLHHSSWQRLILNPLSKARDQTLVLMDTSWVRYHWATTGTPLNPFNAALSYFLLLPEEPLVWLLSS